MLRILASYLSPFILLIFWWYMFSHTDKLIIINSILIVLILLTAKVIFNKYFLTRYLLWISLLVSFIAQVLFLTLMTSNLLRYLLALLLAIIWSLVWVFIRNYFDNYKEIHNTEFLEFNKFFYYLSFYFLISSLYSLIIFINFPVVLAILIIIIVTFIYTKEIIKTVFEVDRKFIYFVTFAISQLFLILYYLPVSFYLSGAILVIFYFFIIDFNLKKYKNFLKYFIIFMISIFILLITSILKY